VKKKIAEEEKKFVTMLKEEWKKQPQHAIMRFFLRILNYSIDKIYKKNWT